MQTNTDVVIAEESQFEYTVYFLHNGSCTVTSVVTKLANGKWRVTDPRLDTGFTEWAKKSTALNKAKCNAANIYHYITRYQGGNYNG